MMKDIIVALGLLFLAAPVTAGAATPIYDGVKRPNDIDSPADVDRLVENTFGPRRPPMNLAPIRADWTAIVNDTTRPPVKIIFDTDIGTDIDDAIALIFALSRPEIDVRAVTTSRLQVDQRAAIVSRLLQVMDRTDIPFAPGSPRMVNGQVHRDKPVDQFPFAGPDADRPKPATDDAQMLFRRAIEANPGQVWLVVVGPMTNAAILIRDHPDIAAKLKGIVCMGGETGRAAVETNIGNDPAAAAIVFRSGMIKFAGTDDVTRALLMPKPDIDRLARLDTPVARALLQLRELWSPQRGTKPGPVVFDVCPVMWLFAPELFTTAAEGVTVDTKGVTRITPGVAPSGMSTGINAVAAHRLLMDTLVHAHPGRSADVLPPAAPAS